MRIKKTFYVIAYDIKDDKLERSVQEKIGKLINKRSDNVIYYYICLDCYTKIVYQPQKAFKPQIVSVV